MYQPVTFRGRISWECARLVAGAGGFRVLPRGEAPPRDVRERLAEHLPPRSTYAVMRANHEGRFLALCLRENGAPWAVAKVATTADGMRALAREAAAIERYGSLLPAPVRAPRILSRREGVLVLEPVELRPRTRPWELPEPLAAALGALARSGVRHGDAAPWNVLAGPDRLVLVDWESAGASELWAWDLCHWLVQTYALLGRPTRSRVLDALKGRGPLGGSVRAFCAAADADIGQLPDAMRTYLAASMETLNLQAADGARGLVARRELAQTLGAA